MKRRPRHAPRCSCRNAALIAALILCGLAAAEDTADGIAFFEAKIRPVLADRCYQCHSAAALRAGKLKAELLLDSRAGMHKGGESGAALVPGKRDEGLLLDAIHYRGLEMPPDGKLPAQVIADFEAWIDMGAPDPRDGPAEAVAKREIDVAAGRDHWSYRRLATVAPPPMQDAAWVRNDIDRFIRAAQEVAGLTPATEAARETLLRRVTFDLTGLPPTPEELQAFRVDESSAAYETVVDRLLASPRFGERWGRHWLDAVRYGESNGYEFDADRGGAFHYRDFVIRALNADMPYDEFLRLQVAGDLLRPGSYQAMSATGLLVAGPYPGQVTAKTIEPIRYDQLDDMATAIGSAALGMTIGCARCHDHKYDPIPQQDYYALIACLRNAVQAEQSVDPDPAATARKLEAWNAERQPLAAAADRYRRETFAASLPRWRDAEAAQPPASWLTLHPQKVSARKATLAAAADDSVSASGKLEADDAYTVVFRTWRRDLAGLRLEALAGTGEPRTGPGTGSQGAFRLSRLAVTAKPLVAAPDRKPVTPKLRAVAATVEPPGGVAAEAVDDQPQTGWSVGDRTGQDHAAVFEFDQAVGFEGGTELTVELFFEAGQHGLSRFRLAAATSPLPAPLDGPSRRQAAGEVLAIVAAAEAAGKRIEGDDAMWGEVLPWCRLADAEAERVFAALAVVDARRPQPAQEKVYAAVNGAWVISGNSQGVRPGSNDVFLLARGEVGRKLGKAEPGFMRATVASDAAIERLSTGADDKPLGDSRLALAAFLTDLEHGAGPLLARVVVNRLWHHHFGRGIVATPNDLGTQGDRPSHPELLEWLAGRLVANNWSLKSIHRLIVTSAAYRQAGTVSAASRAADPENQLLWHRRPNRLEGEAIRDALLAVSGRLDTTMHGPSVADVNAPRRSVYLRVKRSEPISFLQIFDQPEPVQPVGARGVATVPTQSLVMMNSPFVRSAAEGLARRARGLAGGAPPPELLDAVTTIALGRRATDGERERLLPLLAAREQAAAGDPGRREAALADICHLVLCLNEFVYVD
jgi:hypothetical protein